MFASFGKPASAGLHPEFRSVEAASMEWVQSKISPACVGGRKVDHGNFGMNPSFQDLDGRDQTKNIAALFATAPLVSIFLL